MPHLKKMDKEFQEKFPEGEKIINSVFIPQSAGTTNYQLNKLIEVKQRTNILLEKVGEVEDTVEDIKKTVVKKGELLRWYKSSKDTREGIVVKRAPFVDKTLKGANQAQQKIALCKEMDRLFNTK